MERLSQVNVERKTLQICHVLYIVVYGYFILYIFSKVSYLAIAVDTTFYSRLICKLVQNKRRLLANWPERGISLCFRCQMGWSLACSQKLTDPEVGQNVQVK